MRLELVLHSETIASGTDCRRGAKEGTLSVKTKAVARSMPESEYSVTHTTFLDSGQKAPR